MIRVRDKATGAEAEWDGHEWTGDPDFAALLRIACRALRLQFDPFAGYAHVQQRMAETLPQHGFVVVRQTKPVEAEHLPGVVY